VSGTILIYRATGYTGKLIVKPPPMRGEWVTRPRRPRFPHSARNRATLGNAELSCQRK
jgi:hypothetical protein